MHIPIIEQTPQVPNNRRILLRGVISWALAAIFFLIDNLLHICPSLMKPELSASFNLSAASLGFLASSFLWSNGLTQVFAGLLIDKYGSRILLTIACIVCGLGCFIFGVANIFYFAVIGRLLIGVSAAFSLIGCSKIAHGWFSAKQFAFFLGLMMSIGTVGSVFGLTATNQVIVAIGWRALMCGLAAICVGLGWLIWIVVRDQRPDYKCPSELDNSQAALHPANNKQALLKVLFSKQVWAVSVYSGFMSVPILAFGGLWGVPFLMEAHGISKELSGKLVSLIYIGFIIGGPIYGIVSDYIKSRNIPMYFANVSALIIVGLLIYLKTITIVGFIVLMFLLGFFGCGFILSFAVIKESHSPKILGLSISFINMLNTFLGATLQLLVGKLLDLFAKNVLILATGERVFSYADYRIALSSIIICLLVAIGSLFIIKETNCHSIY